MSALADGISAEKGSHTIFVLDFDNSRQCILSITIQFRLNSTKRVFWMVNIIVRRKVFRRSSILSIKHYLIYSVLALRLSLAKLTAEKVSRLATTAPEAKFPATKQQFQPWSGFNEKTEHTSNGREAHAFRNKGCDHITCKEDRCEFFFNRIDGIGFDFSRRGKQHSSSSAAFAFDLSQSRLLDGGYSQYRA